MIRFTLPRFGQEPLSLYIGHYQDGSNNTGVQIVAARNGEEVYATISANVPNVRLPEGIFVFKTYFENDGLFEELTAAGIVEATGKTVDVDMAGPQPICRLTRTL